jgi:hypothetical protein
MIGKLWMDHALILKITLIVTTVLINTLMSMSHAHLWFSKGSKENFLVFGIMILSVIGRNISSVECDISLCFSYFAYKSLKKIYIFCSLPPCI